MSTPKLIGCIQGQGITDMFEMYEHYNNSSYIDLVAVSCCIVERENKSKTARFDYIDELIIENGGKLSKKLHLLGCKHPNEFLRYTSYQRESIHSVDTSAPIIYGWNGIEFDMKGIDLNIKKPDEKAADSLNIELNSQQIDLIAKNVRTFRHYLDKW